MLQLWWFQQFCEYLGGEVDDPPEGFRVTLSNFVFWGMWWSVLAAIIYIFSGQSSKFIYIDF